MNMAGTVRTMRGLISPVRMQIAIQERSLSVSALFTARRRGRAHEYGAPCPCSSSTRSFSDSVTYSGGQASAGQGGFYGSGGSRVKSAPEHRPEAQAKKRDIDEARVLMDEILDIEGKLLAMGNSAVTTESMALKSELNKKARSPKVKELLGRLEIRGEPVWGLDISEREIVRDLRAKYMNL